MPENPEIGPIVRFHRHKVSVLADNEFWNYIIYYSVGEHDVSIERVLDGRRDVQRILHDEFWRRVFIRAAGRLDIGKQL